MSYGATVSTLPTNPSPRENVDTPTSVQDAQDPAVRPSTTTRIQQNLKAFYDRNFGLFLVFLAQTCGSVVGFALTYSRTPAEQIVQMNTAAKLLANDPTIKFHALQIIFIRMLCTTILGSGYMWYHGVADFPFGQKGIRGLLVLRGTAGFIGLFGLYYSLSWLEIADATVITFIVPTMTAFVCFVWLREPFTIKEASAGFIAFCGVLFVARPTWLFPNRPVDPITGQPHPHASTSLALDVQDVHVPSFSLTPQQRTFVILIAIIGAFGASTAYATIRVIGKRAHSLISVNYFAAIATIGSAAIILVHPGLHFVMPKNLTQWGLITIIGLAGFLLQFLLTEGLQREKGGRATNLTYLQLVFALVVERVIWDTTPPVESLIGAVLIIGAAVWVSLQKNAVAAQPMKREVVDEESSLLGSNGEVDTQRGRQASL